MDCFRDGFFSVTGSMSPQPRPYEFFAESRAIVENVAGT